MPGATSRTCTRHLKAEPLWHCKVHASAVTALELSADGSVLYSGCDAAAPKRDPDAPDEEPVKLLSAQDGRTLRSLHTESPANIRLIKTVRQHGSAVLCVDGQRVISVWRETDTASTGPSVMPLEDIDGKQHTVGNPTPDVGSGSGPSTAQSGSYLARLLAAPPSLRAAVLSHDSTKLYTASTGLEDKLIRVWSVGNGRLLQRLASHAAQVLCLALCPDEKLLLSGSQDATIRVWSVKEGSLRRTLKAHRGGVYGLVVSLEGDRLYSCGSDNTIQVWDTARWVRLRALHGRHATATWPLCMTLRCDGVLLASGSSGPCGGSTIKVFDTEGVQPAEAGTCLATFTQLPAGKPGNVSALLFSPDGSVLYSGASDGTVAAWKLTMSQQLGSERALRRGFL